MSSDPGDPDDEAAALRARLNRLSGELKGRAAPPPCSPSRSPTPKSGASAGFGDVAWLAGRQRVRLGGDHRLGDRLGSRPRAPHKSCVSDCIFLDRRCGGDLECDPHDFAKTASLKRNSPLSRANSPDKDVRRSASPSRKGRLVGGARSRWRGSLSLERGGQRRRTSGRGDKSRDRRWIRSTNLPCTCRFDSGRGP